MTFNLGKITPPLLDKNHLFEAVFHHSLSSCWRSHIFVGDPNIFIGDPHFLFGDPQIFMRPPILIEDPMLLL